MPDTDPRWADPLAALDRLIALHVPPAMHGHLGDDDDNAAEFVRRGIRALQDALTEYRRDHYDDHMAGHRVDQADVRCFRPYCDLRYAERDQYGCPAGLDGHGAHRYDVDELADALVCDDPIHQYANQFKEADGG